MTNSKLIPGEAVKVDGETGVGIYIEERWAPDPGEQIARVRLEDGKHAWFPLKAVSSAH